MTSKNPDSRYAEISTTWHVRYELIFCQQHFFMMVLQQGQIPRMPIVHIFFKHLTRYLHTYLFWIEKIDRGLSSMKKMIRLLAILLSDIITKFLRLQSSKLQIIFFSCFYKKPISLIFFPIFPFQILPKWHLLLEWRASILGSFSFW